MLIEFRVKNFRSIRDELVFSLVASKDTSFRESHILDTGINAIPGLLRSSAIYGANASGKSNIIKALQYMKGIVIESATLFQPGQTFGVQPFRLAVNTISEPTEFEATILIDGVRYQYGFAMTSLRIVREYLLVYKTFKPQRWFERRYDAESERDIYEFGASLKGMKSTWEAATRPNALFLSMATQLNSEDLKPVFQWFSDNLVVVNEQAPLGPQFSLDRLQNPEGRKEICSFLNAADISIVDVDVEIQKLPGRTFRLDFASGKTEMGSNEVEQPRIRFHHKTANAEAVFDIGDESSGTRNLLFLSGPVLDILRRGLTLVIDELDTSLHPLLVRELVRLFNRSEINLGGAQLVFTSHDTSLLSAPGLFRRDQVWVVEKDPDQATTLSSLSDFSVRKGEAIERGYLMGRYGGVPLLDSDFGFRDGALNPQVQHSSERMVAWENTTHI